MNTRLVRSVVVSLAVVSFVACASQPQAVPEVSLSQMTAVPEVRVDSASGLPMEYRLRIDNPFEHPVTLVSIEVESVGNSGSYAMNRVRHAFSRIIAANSSDSVDFRAWVFPLSRDTKGSVASPVMLRGTARFETPSGSMRRNFVSRGQ